MSYVMTYRVPVYSSYRDLSATEYSERDETAAVSVSYSRPD